METKDDFGLLSRDVEFEQPLKHYYKQILTSLWLLLMGLTLLGAGFVLLFTNERKSHWLGCFVLGSILFIPGAYHSRIVYLSVRRKQGYTFSHLGRF